MDHSHHINLQFSHRLHFNFDGRVLDIDWKSHKFGIFGKLFDFRRADYFSSDGFSGIFHEIKIKVL
jgi:hypothetical protein